MVEQTRVDNRKWRVVRIIIMSGWTLNLIAKMAIVGVALYMWTQGPDIAVALAVLAGAAAKSIFDDSDKFMLYLKEEEANPTV